MVCIDAEITINEIKISKYLPDLVGCVVINNDVINDSGEVLYTLKEAHGAQG